MQRVWGVGVKGETDSEKSPKRYYRSWRREGDMAKWRIVNVGFATNANERLGWGRRKVQTPVSVS